MANLSTLLALLGAQGSGGPFEPTLPIGTPPYAPAQGEDIVVTPSRSSGSPVTYNVNEREDPLVQVQQAPGDTSPYPRTEASPQDKARSNPLSGLSPHKGLFGVKGTLRDILGLVGDSLLIAGGGKGIYGATRQREREGDSLVGYGQGSETDDQAAIARLMQVNPELGTQLAERHAAQAIARQQAQQVGVKNSSERLAKARDYAARLMANVQTPEDFAYAKNVIERTTGIPIDQLGLSDADTPEQRGIFSQGDMTVNQQEMRDLRNRQVNQGDRRLDQTDTRQTEIQRHNKRTEEISASKRPQPRAPSRATASNIDAEVLAAIQSGTATPQQQKYFDNRLARGKSGNALKELISGQPSGKPAAPKFKPGQIIYKGGKAYKVNADGKTATPQ